MKGRLNSNIYTTDGIKIPYYLIEDIIGKDTKNVMSTTLIKTTDDNYICHIELQPEKKSSYENIINGIMQRLKNNIPEEILKVLYIKVRESFYLAPSGKRDSSSLVNEGLTTDCISCKEYLKLNDNIKKRILNK